MKRRYFPVLFSVALMAVPVFLLITGRQEAQQKPRESDEATLVQKGVMTEKQRRHSKEYEDQEIPGITTSKEQKVGVYIEIEPRPLPDKAKTSNSSEYLQALTCASITDVVVVGKIANKASQLTENSRFVFTDYDVEVIDILKGPVGDDVTSPKLITLTDAGGAVRLDGQTIFVKISREHPLRVGYSYVLFLRRLTNSDTYKLIGERGIFAIAGENIEPAHYSFPERFSYRDVAEQIRSIAGTCRAKN